MTEASGPLSRWILMICLLTVLPAAAFAATETAGILDVELSPAEITVGDRLEARLTLVWTGPEPAATPSFPAWRQKWGDAEILSAGEVETLAGQDGPRVYRQDLVLTAFTTGEIRLPEVTITLVAGGETIDVASGPDAGFEVLSVLPEDAADARPRPPAPPRPLAPDARFAWTAAGLGAFALVAAWLMGHRLRLSAAAIPPPPAEPLAELLDRLKRLDPAAAEPAHTGLSLGLRNFLGRRLGFPAAESTTTEIERRLRRARVDPQSARSTVGLLRDCDLVKFAGLSVAASVTRGRLVLARDLGHRIERGLQPAPDAEHGPLPQESAPPHLRAEEENPR